MPSRDQYLKALIRRFGGYHLKSKKEKSRLLSEYCRTTGQNRKYAIWKIRKGKYVPDPTQGRKTKRKRKKHYNSYVAVALIKCAKIFSWPCGQRLKPLLETEVDRLRKLKELDCSDNVAEKLKKIAPCTIDEKLKREKQMLHHKRRYNKASNPLLYQNIPVKLSFEQNKTVLGNLQIDLVEHCGWSTTGEYICTISSTDIATGWFEGQAVIGKSQKAVFQGLLEQRKRFPFLWVNIHTDNGSEFINDHLYRYSQSQGFGFSRSRPYQKNDNCFAEQKNSTHVRKLVGHYRYNTKEELTLLNQLYQKQRLYKNFFQPVIKLKTKVRIKGKIHRKYEKAKTPYHRLMESKEPVAKTKKQLKQIYDSINPAELKREIDKMTWQLYKVYQNKQNRSKVESKKIKLSKNIN